MQQAAPVWLVRQVIHLDIRPGPAPLGAEMPSDVNRKGAIDAMVVCLATALQIIIYIYI